MFHKCVVPTGMLQMLLDIGTLTIESVPRPYKKLYPLPFARVAHCKYMYKQIKQIRKKNDNIPEMLLNSIYQLFILQ